MNGKWIICLWACAMPAICAEECLQHAPNPKPVKMVYRSDSAHQRAIIFKPGSDGILRAFDAMDNAELWSFSPPGLDITHRAGGLMSEARVLSFDANHDGFIGSGDKVWLYFGLRRGGRYYYALDVTDPGSPKLLWQLGPDELPDLGETWSAPVITRVRVAGSLQNGERLVLILSGGNDDGASGHHIYMVDAASGRLLWYAGDPVRAASGTLPDLPLDQMTYSVVANVVAIDTDGDQFADRLYAADVGGQLWRFDIWNGHARADLVTGGVLASLAGPNPADARRFYNAPDVALIQPRGAAPHFNLAIGSGNRSDPFDVLTHDRFYSIRDRNPFERFSQSVYEAQAPLIDDDLPDISSTLDAATIPATPAGWRFELRLNSGWSGEKVLAEALTLDGMVLFTTYQPPSVVDCSLSGKNRVYALNLEQGRPVLDFNDDGEVTGGDASTPLEQGGIAGAVELVLPTQRKDPDANSAPQGDPVTPAPARCEIGAETLRLCVTPKVLLREYWQH